MMFRWFYTILHIGLPKKHLAAIDCSGFVVEFNNYNIPGIESYVSYSSLAGRTSNSEGIKTKWIVASDENRMVKKWPIYIFWFLKGEHHLEIFFDIMCQGCL